jgi:hypothetical protein
MTRDDIVRMAREVGLWPSVTDTFPKELQDFAAIVAAAEREACAKVCDVLADKHTFEGGYANECAIAIRERGAP